MSSNGWMELKKALATLNTQELAQTMKTLLEGKVAPFMDFFKEYISCWLNYCSFDGDKPYHMLLRGCLTYFAETHHIRSNRESDNGHYDIGLEPKAAYKGMKAIIIEIKVADEGANLKQVAKKALQQIKKKDYKADMEARSITDYVLLGMAFSGKAVEVVYA